MEKEEEFGCSIVFIFVLVDKKLLKVYLTFTLDLGRIEIA
jgi:hypothetical protein